jgi:protein-tyrosine-phosphatase
MRRALLVCVHNSGRSQMAAAFARHRGPGVVEVDSAGTQPAPRVNPAVVEAMSERGIDLSHNRPKRLTQEMVDRVDRVITMGCSIKEECPAGFVPTEDWGIDDPKGKSPDEVRKIRDQIEEKVRVLLQGPL